MAEQAPASDPGNRVGGHRGAGTGRRGLVVQQFYEGTVLSPPHFYGSLRVFDWDQEGAGAPALSPTASLFTARSTWPRPWHTAQPSTTQMPQASGMPWQPWPRIPRRTALVSSAWAPETMAAYGRAGDVMRFYEINPQVHRHRAA